MVGDVLPLEEREILCKYLCLPAVVDFMNVFMFG